MKKMRFAFFICIFFRFTFVYSQIPVLQFTLYGEKPGSTFGTASAAGDVNGDGYPDFLVTASGENYVNLYYGGSAFYSGRYIKLQKPKTIPFAWAANGVGDINGDGYSDFAIGSKYYGNGSVSMPGKVWIYYGGINIDTSAVLEIEGLYLQDTFGSSIKPAGDVNGDGYGDFLISAPYNWSNAKGYVVLILGGETINDINIRTFQSGNSNDWFGESIEGVGDINKDGFDDFIVGAPRGDVINNAFPGKAYVYFGNSEILNTAAYIIEDTTIYKFGEQIISGGDINGDGNREFFVGNISTTKIFNINGQLISIANAGTICAELDLNKDGFYDFIIGNGQGYNNYGVMTGSLNIMLGNTIIDTIPKFKLNGKYHWEGFGGVMNSIGDINQDGFPEFSVSMPSTYPEPIQYQDNHPIGMVEIYSFSTIVGATKHEIRLPLQNILKQNYPNPFNPTTVIKYSVANSVFVTIKIYNMLSQEVATLVNEIKSAGTHQVSFNAGKLPSGIYLARIQAGGYSKSIKMQLVK